MYRIAKANLNALYAAIAASKALYLPVKSAGKTNFAAWTEGAAVDLDTLKTVRSPKDAFFPQSENLDTCDRVDGKISIPPEALQEKPFVVFGMKACDVRGVAVLDKVFLSDPVDSYYAARREKGIIVATSNRIIVATRTTYSGCASYAAPIRCATS